jgi:mRNA interferase MazF
LKRGEIWVVDFEPSVGSEIRKVRPALIVSNDAANRHNTKVTLVPITGTIRENPLVVVINPAPSNGLDRPSMIKVPDVTTFDKSRLKRRLGKVGADEMLHVEDRLRTHLLL